MAAGPRRYQSGEGGGPNPPYGEDFFQRIVGVHWPTKRLPVGARPVFAASGQTNLQHIILIGQTTDADAHGIQFAVGHNAAFTENDSIFGSSSHVIGPDVNGKYTSIMLVGGTTGGSGYTDGTIGASVDGGAWTKVANFHDSSSEFGSDYNDTIILAMVYDEAAHGFYACGRNIQYRSNPVSHGIEASYFETLYSSSNGLSWSEVRRRQFYDSEGNPPLPDPVSPDLFLEHCNNIPRLQDGAWGGYVTISPINGEVIESLTAVVSSPPVLDLRNNYLDCSNSGPSIDVAYYKQGGGGFSGTVDAPFPVNGVAYAGGVLVATGGLADGTDGQTAVSYDYGKTWVASFGPEKYSFVTVCGGFMS